MFYELHGEPLGWDERNLTLPRARGILRALQAQPAFRPVAVMGVGAAGDRVESLIVDVDLAVPQDVKIDIRAVERIAICCESSDSDYPAVLVLRCDFPRTSHQFHTGLDQPCALCLYETPFEEQRLMWNPSEFIGRIPDWLERTALGTLHPDDQPAEPFFYASASDVLIPSNMRLENTIGPSGWAIGNLVYRTRDERGAFTCHLELASEQTVSELHASGHFVPRVMVVVTDPCEHGLIHLLPKTLGELNGLLTRLGVDIRARLREQLRDMVRGSTWSDRDLLILVVRIPLLRQGVVANESLVSFLFRDDLGRIGEQLDATTALVGGKRRAIEVLRYDDAKADALVIEPCNAYRDSTAAGAQFMSGASEAAPPPTIVLGAGAVGSHVFSSLLRSGWSVLTVVDHDHLRAHNLVRHVLPRRFVGRNKAIALCEFFAELWHGVDLVAIPRRAANACTETAFIERLKNVSLILDCSASQAGARTAALDWPSQAQRISAFLTPDGSGAAVLAEDASRKVWLDAVEAQYYRLLINEPMVAEHLAGKVAMHRYGLGCRDRTFVMPPESIGLWSAFFVRAIRRSMGADEGSITIFTVNADGAVLVHRFAVAPERRAQHLTWTIVYDDDLVARLDCMRRARPRVETGGALLGYYDVERRIVYLVDALDAPSDSVEAADHFVRGAAGLNERLQEIRSRTGGSVSLVGDWHSHPPRVPASPSSEDVDLLVAEGLLMAEDGLPGLIAIVGDQGVSFVCAAEITRR